jgi:hypothetical protein
MCSHRRGYNSQEKIFNVKNSELFTLEEGISFKERFDNGYF